MSYLLPSIAAHVSTTEAIYSADMLISMLAGDTYVINGQLVKATPTERTILKETGWASRPTKVQP